MRPNQTPRVVINPKSKKEITYSCLMQGGLYRFRVNGFPVDLSREFIQEVARVDNYLDSKGG